MIAVDYTFRLPASTPPVSRSNAVRDDDVILVEGAQFEDGKYRIVVGPDVSDDAMKALDKALFALDAMSGRLRWLSVLFAPDHTRQSEEVSG